MCAQSFYRKYLKISDVLWYPELQNQNITITVSWILFCLFSLSRWRIFTKVCCLRTTSYLYWLCMLERRREISSIFFKTYFQPWKIQNHVSHLWNPSENGRSCFWVIEVTRHTWCLSALSALERREKQLNHCFLSP